jgi:branched-chain amino acid transport system substrate-binding protein
MNSFKSALVLAGSLAMLSLAGCKPSTTETAGGAAPKAEAKSDSTPIKIGMVSFLSGAGAPWATSLKSAGELAVKEINDKGGVLGRKVELIISDSNTDPATANVQAKSLIEKDQIAALFAADTSATRNALYPIINKAEIPFFYTIVYEGGEYNKYMYVNGALPKQVLGPVIPYLAKDENAKKWFVVGNDYVFPQKTAAAAKALVEKAGGSVVGQEFTPLGTSEFSPILAKIKAAQPDFVLQVLVGSDAVSFVKQMKAAGLNEKTKILAVAVEENSVQAMGESAEGIFATGEYFQAIDTPENKAFIENYKKIYGADAKLQTFMSMGIYESIHLWALAAAKAESLKWDKINSVIGTVSFSGPRGTVQYETKTNHSNLPVYLTRVKDGQLKLVESFGIVSPAD